jgi:hypothetical protein
MNGLGFKAIIVVSTLFFSTLTLANTTKMMAYSAGCMTCHQAENRQNEQPLLKKKPQLHHQKQSTI